MLAGVLLDAGVVIVLFALWPRIEDLYNRMYVEAEALTVSLQMELAK